ncbi:hypothetical protein CCVT_1076 [Campylobacter curvus]|nr:hypothetical protein CCVT_1076 [Campylobacter curvus]
MQLRDEVEAKLRYEDREAVADRGLLAVASVMKQKIVLYVRLLAPAQTLFASVLGRSWSEQGFCFITLATAKQKRSKYQYFTITFKFTLERFLL